MVQQLTPGLFKKLATAARTPSGFATEIPSETSSKIGTKNLSRYYFWNSTRNIFFRILPATYSWVHLAISSKIPVTAPSEIRFPQKFFFRDCISDPSGILPGTRGIAERYSLFTKDGKFGSMLPRVTVCKRKAQWFLNVTPRYVTGN